MHTLINNYIDVYKYGIIWIDYAMVSVCLWDIL